MRWDWTGPARTKSREEWGSALLRGPVRGDGWRAKDRPNVWGLLWAIQQGGGGGVGGSVGPTWVRTIWTVGAEGVTCGTGPPSCD